MLSYERSQLLLLLLASYQSYVQLTREPDENLSLGKDTHVTRIFL